MRTAEPKRLEPTRQSIRGEGHHTHGRAQATRANAAKHPRAGGIMRTAEPKRLK
jgi:hypothetical protein